MTQILKFPTKPIRSVTVRTGSKHRIGVEVRDFVRPRRTRWAIQFEIQEVAGFAALSGFTDTAVANGYRHHFAVNGTSATRRFVSQTANLVGEGKVAIWIDGERVRPRLARPA